MTAAEMTANQEGHLMGSNHIVHAEVVGKDGAKIQQFFSDLFGWSLDTNNPGGYGMSDPTSTGVAFGAGGTPDGSDGHVTFYVSVDDLDATIDRVQALGGTIVMSKYSPAPGVALALAADPEGHILGLTQA
jgi:predicted enzyme related to lactoylglutathione lyase